MIPLPQPRLESFAIVIVTYRSRGCIDLCLGQLARDGLLSRVRGERARPEVIVVDSGSDDGTADHVEAQYPGVRLVRSARNIGFARGVNLGCSVRTRDDIVLLNPDAVCPRDTLEAARAYLDAHPEVGAVGPALVGAEAQPQIATQQFPSFQSELTRQWERVARLLDRMRVTDRQPTLPGAVDWVSGACLFLRGAAWRDVGTLDERFFLYYEETDWCRRAWLAGWAIHFLPHVTCMHVGGASAAVGDAPVRKGRVARVFRQSRRRYFRKHHGWWVALAVESLHGARALRRRLQMPSAREAVTS